MRTVRLLFRGDSGEPEERLTTMSISAVICRWFRDFSIAISDSRLSRSFALSIEVFTALTATARLFFWDPGNRMVRP